MPAIGRKNVSKSSLSSSTKTQQEESLRRLANWILKILCVSFSNRSSFSARLQNIGSAAAANAEPEHEIYLPRHAVFPELPPAQGELFFECTLFLYSVLAMFLQYLNLYKTMWWLPHSHVHHSLVRFIW